MNRIMGILDLFFPKRCVGCRKFGSYLCSSCFSYITFWDKGVCFVCQQPAVDGLTYPVCHTKYALDGAFSSVVYVGVVKRLVYQFKYNPHITDLTPLMLDLFYEGIIQKEVFWRYFSNECVFIPIPLHASRMRKRGYNQSMILAKGLADKFNIDIEKSGVSVWDCLERVRNTHTQVGLKQKERKENIQDAFVAKKQFLERLNTSASVFLVDDIVTSGATLLEAAKVLKKAGAGKVWGITLAHGQ